MRIFSCFERDFALLCIPTAQRREIQRYCDVHSLSRGNGRRCETEQFTFACALALLQTAIYLNDMAAGMTALVGDRNVQDRRLPLPIEIRNRRFPNSI